MSGRPGDVFMTSDRPRTTLPYVNCSVVRALATVAVTTSAATIERQRALAQLTKLASDGDADAVTMLESEALKTLVIENDSTTVPFDTSVQREWTGVWKRR